MKKKNKIYILVAAVLLIAAILTFFMLRTKTVKVGVLVGAPMAYQDLDGTWKGFDIDFANKMFAEMNCVPEFVEVTATTGSHMLKKGEIDCYMSGSYLPSQDFFISADYLSSVQVVCRNKELGIEISKLEDLAQYRVGVLNNSKNQITLKEYVPQHNILEHSTNGETLQMLDIFDIDFAVVDYMFVQNFIENNKQNKEYDVEMVYGVSENCIVFGSKGKKMCEQANEIIKQYKQDGYFDALKTEYNMNEFYK